MEIDKIFREYTSRFRRRMNDPEVTSQIGYNLLGLAGFIGGYLVAQDSSNLDALLSSITTGTAIGSVVGGAGGEVLGLYLQNRMR